MKMFNKKGDKDEREISVEKSSYSLAYNIITYAILVDVIYRSFVLKQTSLDLVGIVVLGGLAATLYQTRYKIATRNTGTPIVVAIISGIVIAAASVFLNR